MRWSCCLLHFMGCCLTGVKIQQLSLDKQINSVSVSAARIKHLQAGSATDNNSNSSEGPALNASSGQLNSGLQLLQGPDSAVVGKLTPEKAEKKEAGLSEEELLALVRAGREASAMAMASKFNKPKQVDASPTLSYSDYWQDPEVKPRPAPASSSLLAVASRVKKAFEAGSRRLAAAAHAEHSVYFISAVSLGLACLTILCCLATEPWKKGRGSRKGPREQVEALPRCSDEEELEQYLPTELEGGYDCALSRPLSSGVPLRLEATVEEVSQNLALVAPLTGRSCVLYSAAVARQLHGGMHPVPLAFATANQKVILRVRGSQGLRVELSGEDVFLFDMIQGYHSTHCKFADAPDHWQDFVLTHRAAALGGEFQPSSALRAEREALEFQECSLLVGAKVTAVGELHRSSNGSLSLRPCSGEGGAAAAGLVGSNLTAWERRGTQTAAAATLDGTVIDAEEGGSVPPKQAGMCKVWVSDDPTLLGSSDNLLKRCGL